MKKTKKADRGCNPRWAQLEDILEDWILTQRAACHGVSTCTTQIRLRSQPKIYLNVDSVVVHPGVPASAEKATVYVPVQQKADTAR